MDGIAFLSVLDPAACCQRVPYTIQLICPLILFICICSPVPIQYFLIFSGTVQMTVNNFPHIHTFNFCLDEAHQMLLYKWHISQKSFLTPGKGLAAHA